MRSYIFTIYLYIMHIAYLHEIFCMRLVQLYLRLRKYHISFQYLNAYAIRWFMAVGIPMAGSSKFPRPLELSLRLLLFHRYDFLFSLEHRLYTWHPPPSSTKPFTHAHTGKNDAAGYGHEVISLWEYYQKLLLTG